MFKIREMQLKFRTRLLGIGTAIALSFIILITSNIVIKKNIETELSKIHKSYIPLIEIGPRLESQFSNIMRGLQDSVAAYDLEGLKTTETLNRQLVNELGKAAEIIYPGAPGRVVLLQTAVATTYAVAHDVSVRLMRNETGIPIVNAMDNLKTSYGQTKTLLHEALGFNKEKLAEAFSAVNSVQKTGERLQIFIGGSCLALVIAILIWISRSVLSSLTFLTEGLLRFSQGNFDIPIPITSQDEFGEVARNANLMAKQIQTLLFELRATNKELESFSYSVAHDLRAPLRASIGFSHLLLKNYASIIPPDAQDKLNRIVAASKKMGELIDGLLSLSRIARNTMVIENINLSTLAEEALLTLRQGDPERKVTAVIEKDVMSKGDLTLLRIVFANLIGNAWKFSSKKAESIIEFGKCIEDGQTVFFVRDNGAGFDMRYSDKLFGTFQRLHAESEFEGTGLGLATVQRIIFRHHGKIWAKSEPDKGATFFFNIGETKGENAL